MPVLTDISTVYRCLPEGRQADVHPIGRAAIAWRGDRIEWVGPRSELPEAWNDEPNFSAHGMMVVPGLVDCHTHLCFGGWRADEFEARLLGKSYLDIARKGGGILRTVRQTRDASEEALVAHGRAVLRQMAALGVTTVECKSGYGLSTEDELKLLRAYGALRREERVGLVSTFLGAHTIPIEFRDRREAYVALVCDEMIPAVTTDGLADFCDVFVEDTAFTPDEARRILGAGKAAGLAPKLHVDQLSDGGGASLAAEVGAVSADHLEYAADSGMKQMAARGVVAVCLPLATLYLRQRPMPARRFLEAGVRVAVATDFNPGSAPSFDLPLAMMLSCTMNGLTPAEALRGATTVAAAALGRADTIGSIAPGWRADFAVIDAPDVNHWLYHFRPNACAMTYLGGKPAE
jgi:imidazolonepropionase